MQFGRDSVRVWLLVAMVAIAIGCDRHAPAAEHPAEQPATTAAAQPARSTPPQAPTVQGRDLSIDESMGGHTLARHVGETDAQLAERLRREPQISAASTYTDQATAARAVAAALASSSGVSFHRRVRGPTTPGHTHRRSRRLDGLR